ncbi:SDR family oxidoreductase [Magnetococcales bacterium HHB-1]
MDDEDSFLIRVWRGLKFSMIATLCIPFSIVLFPLWFIYRWRERRAGRPDPAPPWRGLLTRQQRVDRFHIPDDLLQSTPPLSQAQKIPFAANPPTCLDSVRSFSGVAVVTGGAQRLGALIVEDLARLGFTVAVVYHQSKLQAENLQTVLVEKGFSVALFQADLTEHRRCIDLLSQVEKDLGRIDLLVNNAAQFYPTPVKEAGSMEYQRMAELIQLNLVVPMVLSLEVAGFMRDGGQIINLCDLWAERPLAGYSAYCASKAGLVAATKGLARDLAPRIRVNGVAPGAVLPPEERGERVGFAKMLENTPLRLHAEPEAVLQAIRYLLEARFVTGEVLMVDGGRGLR